jgi:hypothetical protein
VSQQFKTSITYFLQEGRDNLQDCLRIAFEAAANHRIGKIVIFTAEGLGVKVAIDQFLTDEKFQHIILVAVTFPAGYPFTDLEGKPKIVDISAADREIFRQRDIPIIKAHLPFDPIAPTFKERGFLGQDLSLVGNALNMFGGSMSLCVQAILLSCDAGIVNPAEHVIALTSDTAILAQASPTKEMLRGLVIREILCKPAIYSIGRGEKNISQSGSLEGESISPRELLPLQKPQLLPPEKK